MAHTSRLQRLFGDERFQLAYGVALIVLIPTAIILATVSTIRRYSQTIDVTLQRQALLVGRVFAASVLEDGLLPAQLQRHIAAVTRANADVLGLQIFAPQGEGRFAVVASSRLQEVGISATAPYYTLAWQQAEGEGLATDVLGGPVTPDGTPALARVPERSWLVSLPLFADPDRNGRRERVALLTLQLSSAVVDRQSEASWRSAVLGLTVTVLLTVLFLAAATRLWGYATLYRRMREIDRLKDEFISIASHELRAPVTAVRGYLEMIVGGDYGALTKRQRHGVDRAAAAANRLAELVEDLLEVSRIELKRIQLEPGPVNLAAAAQAAVTDQAPLAREKSLTLAFRGPSGTPPVVTADPEKLKEVLVNLISNAIKYTPRGGIIVTVSVDEDETVGLIKVKDTGVGISAEAQARLFSKFYRVDRDQTHQVPGTGLGLWITKQLVELMHGQTFLESIEGTGTVVTVHLPLHRRQDVGREPAERNIGKSLSQK